jgi:hypothetical protein
MFFMVIFLSKGLHGKPGDHGGKISRILAPGFFSIS